MVITHLLSPYLWVPDRDVSYPSFDLALDPLLRYLPPWSGLQGMSGGSEELQISTFADDLYTSKPQLTLALLLKDIESKDKLMGH